MTEEQILEELKSSYESIYEIPSVSGGRLSADGSITVVLSQRDIRNNTNRSYLQYYRKFNDKYEPSGFPVQMGANVHASSISPDGKFLALFVKTGKDDEPGFGHTKAVDYAIELWDRTRVVKQVIVKDTHGKVVNDEYFGRVTWASNSKLVYVAEMKTSAPKTVWDKEYDHNKESHFDIVNQEDYGEGLVGTKLTRAFVCNFETRSVTEVAGVPSKIAVSSPIWSPDGQGVIFVGFDVSKKRLGLKYCVQRESALYYSEADKDCEMLTEGVWNARRPVVDQSGKRIAFLSTGKVPFHMTCNKLMIVRFKYKHFNYLD
jgi:acylaminoacyl-peptidase